MPDNDPLESLDNFPEGLHVNALPASEVRRRGDRMRRRNTALATVGGVVAAAVFIGTPVALLANNNDGKNDVQPAPSPSIGEDAQPEWLTEIPAGFPLADGFPETNGFDGSPTEVIDNPAPIYVSLCGVDWPTVGPIDASGINYTGESEDTSDRTLLLLADEEAATASLAELREAVQACPHQPTSGGDSVIESQLVDLDLGTEGSVVVALQVRDDDGLLSQLAVTEVAQSGNAVFIEQSYGSAAGPDVVKVETERLRERSATVLTAMCVFAADPCSTTDISPSETDSPDPVESVVEGIPADFPLTTGFPADDAETTTKGPDAFVEAAPQIDLCGTPAWLPAGVVQRLAVQRTGPEFLDARELVTFATVDEAIAAVTAVEAAVAACPDRPGGEGTGGYTNRVLAADTGYETFTWGTFARSALDGGVFQITRIGYSVLVVYAAGEMSESSLQPVAEELTVDTKAIAPAMCRYTEDGC